MNPEQENFEALRKLLALKKYEQPPPRYFSELPNRIWAGIERVEIAVPFWQRLFPNMGLSPAFAYSFGLLACGTLFFGIASSLNTEPQPALSQPIPNGNWPTFSPTLATKDGLGINLSSYIPAQLASTNPVMDSGNLPSLFQGVNLHAPRVNYFPQ